MEDVVEREEVDEFGRVLAVGGGKARDHGLGDVLEARRPMAFSSVPRPVTTARATGEPRSAHGPRRRPSQK